MTSIPARTARRRASSIWAKTLLASCRRRDGRSKGPTSLPLELDIVAGVPCPAGTGAPRVRAAHRWKQGTRDGGW
ncbi:hypothetical protein caldi_24370 [Caldinitratiruptor microaerophilus]|uniref:Uncharacterized protein n=1 Tax=Caldinitratiruptor microaerophilus TaxID=671077 RepID=A0AA35CP62_9FIRM|nr:hypothetical protein caldi_24370 [Caldinitratiruptor microaerophilus]